MRCRHILGSADELDDLINMIECLLQTQEYVFAVLRFGEIVLCSALYDLGSMLHVFLEDSLQREGLWHTIDKSDHVVMERIFKLCVFVELVEHCLRIRPGFELYDHSNVGSGFVTHLTNTLDLLISHQTSDLFLHVCLVHTEWDRGDDDREVTFLIFNDLSFTTHHNSSFAVGICMRDRLLIKSHSPHWEIRTLDEFQEIIRSCIRIIYQMCDSITELTKVVRRNVSSHSHRDTKRPHQ